MHARDMLRSRQPCRREGGGLGRLARGQRGRVENMDRMAVPPLGRAPIPCGISYRSVAATWSADPDALGAGRVQKLAELVRPYRAGAGRPSAGPNAFGVGWDRGPYGARPVEDLRGDAPRIAQRAGTQPVLQLGQEIRVESAALP